MITIEMIGGLGNQMFQYALFHKMKYLKKDVRIDVQSCFADEAVRKYSLDIFGIKLDSIPYCMGESLPYKIVNRLVNHRMTYDEIELGKVGEYQPRVLNIKNGRLRGYWQNERYFDDISSIIKSVYTFDEKKVKVENLELMRELTAKESISVHIRRGDYRNPENLDVYGTICDKQYYDRAFGYFREKFSRCDFYLFSDDIEWTKQNIYDEGMHIIDWNTNYDSWQDMYLMSKCRHHIIANSTFSWWGAWLGDYNDKIVVSPSRWFANNNSSDTICKSWVRI